MGKKAGGIKKGRRESKQGLISYPHYQKRQACMQKKAGVIKNGGRCRIIVPITETNKIG